jgi:FkbM family methyltransferase
MLRSNELLIMLDTLQAYANAQAWERSLEYPTIKRFLLRFKHFGLRYFLSALVHYATVLIPQLGRLRVSGKTFWGKKVFLELRAAESYQILFRGASGSEPEVRLTYFLLRRLASTDVFYDVGANIGYYSMLAAELGAYVHAFEPVPSTFRILDLNVAQYRNRVVTNCVALSSEDGTASMFLPEDWYITSTLVEQTLQSITKNTITVPTCKLDTYVNGQNKPAPTIMKIDVEGAELLVLKGGSSTIADYHPIIIMEVCPGQRGLDLSVPAAEFLLKHGYKMYSLSPEGNLLPISDTPFDYITTFKGEFDNLVFQQQ